MQVVKVLDFGVARAEFDREGVTGSMQFGTARYIRSCAAQSLGRGGAFA